MASKGQVYVVADFLEHKGKWYATGDAVPMSDAEAAHMLASGSRTIRVVSDEATVVAISSTSAPTAPTDDAGQPITTAAAKKVAEAAAAETVATMAVGGPPFAVGNKAAQP